MHVIKNKHEQNKGKKDDTHLPLWQTVMPKPIRIPTFSCRLCRLRDELTFISLLLQLQEVRWSWQEMHNIMWWKCMHGFTISMLLSIVYCHANSSAAVEYAAVLFLFCFSSSSSFLSPPPPPAPPTTWTQPVIQNETSTPSTDSNYSTRGEWKHWTVWSLLLGVCAPCAVG